MNPPEWLSAAYLVALQKVDTYGTYPWSYEMAIHTEVATESPHLIRRISNWGWEENARAADAMRQAYEIARAVLEQVL